MGSEEWLAWDSWDVLVCQRNSYPDTNSAGFILLAKNKARFWLDTTTAPLRKQLSFSPVFLPSKGDLTQSWAFWALRCRGMCTAQALCIPMVPINRTDTYNSKGRCTKTLLLYGNYNQSKFTKVEFTVPITCVLSVSKCGHVLAGCHPEARVPLGEVLPFSFFFCNLHLHGTLAAMHYSVEHWVAWVTSVGHFSLHILTRKNYISLLTGPT